MGTEIGAVHAYLAGGGRDGRGRTAEEVLALPDLDLERIHDWVQWLFPLPTRSAAVPGSPVLDPAEIATIIGDIATGAGARTGAGTGAGGTR